MRPAKFKIESLGYERFDGFTKDENWNGWDCPYFTFDQAQKILKHYNDLRRIIGQAYLAYYDSDVDSFVFPINVDDEPEVFAAVNENGQKFYPIGTFYWIWKEDEHDQ